MNRILHDANTRKIELVNFLNNCPIITKFIEPKLIYIYLLLKENETRLWYQRPSNCTRLLHFNKYLIKNKTCSEIPNSFNMRYNKCRTTNTENFCCKCNQEKRFKKEKKDK